MTVHDAPMAWTLEVVVVPVSDVDAAKHFYADQVGFRIDHDVQVSDEMRVVQLTPPGSGCSIVIGTDVGASMEPGAVAGLQLVVADVERARAELADRGVEVSAVQRLGEHPDADDPLDHVGFCYFDDPDGNSWAVQQISARAVTA